MSSELEWLDEFSASFSCDPKSLKAMLRLEPAKASREPVDRDTVKILDWIKRSLREGGEFGFAQKLYDESYQIQGWAKQNPVPGESPAWTSEGTIPGPYRPNVVISPVMTLDPRVVPEGGYSSGNPPVPGVPGPANDEGIWLVYSTIVGVSALYAGYRWARVVKGVKALPEIKLIIERLGFVGYLGGGLAGWAITKKIGDLTGTNPGEGTSHGGGNGQSSSPAQPDDQ